MPSQGPNSPATASGGFTNPSDCLTSNDARAGKDVAPSGTSGYLRVTGFGFSIPAGATIDSILVEIEHHNSTSVTPRNQPRDIFLVSGGSQVGDDQGVSVDIPGGVGSEAYVSFGSGTWNAGLSATDINDSGFGVEVQYTNANGAINNLVLVDHIRMTITYTEAASYDPATGLPVIQQQTVVRRPIKPIAYGSRVGRKP